MKKALFLQLPETPVSFTDKRENVPFAAGCIAAHLKKFKIKTAVPDHRKINDFSDIRLIKFITSSKPGWLLFTCYLWNIERTLYIAGEAKKKLPKCKIVLGGPEISPDNAWVFNHGAIDHFVCGEGEETLRNILSGADTRRIICSKNEPEHFYSPYLHGTLNPLPRQPVYIEAQRGCPFSCTFCFYPKNGNKIRYLPLDEIEKILTLARKNGAKEIVFLDPTFNNYKPFENLLKLLAEMNRDRFFEYNAEIKPHMLTDDKISLINKCGFKTLEAGLQTIHKKTQHKIKCIVPLSKFSTNINKISKRIGLRLDLISGLPGERLKDIKASLRYLKNNHPCADIFLYHLSALPGTRIRRDLCETSYQKKPPYYVINNGKMNIYEMRKINETFKNVTGEDLDPLPDLERIYDMRKKYNYFLFSPQKSTINNSDINRLSLMNILEFKSKKRDGNFSKKICEIIKKLTSKSPFSSFVIFINMPYTNQVSLTDAIFKSSKLNFEQYNNRSRLFFNDYSNIRVAFKKT